MVFHVLNRGVGRNQLFFNDQGYSPFTQMDYFLIEMRSNDAYFTSDETLASFEPLCPKCGNRQHNGDIPPVVLTCAPSDIPISFIEELDFPIVRNDFLNALGDKLVNEYFFRGSAFDQSGTKFSDFAVLFRKREKLVLRGNKRSAFRWCDECGCTVYWAHGRKYAVQIDVSDQNPIYPVDICKFALREDVWDRVSKLNLTRISAKPLEIKEHAVDGLPDHLNATSKDVVRNQWAG